MKELLLLVIVEISAFILLLIISIIIAAVETLKEFRSTGKYEKKKTRKGVFKKGKYQNG